MTDKVDIEGDTLRLLSQECVLDAQHRDALYRIYFVRAGSDISIYNADVEFHVFRFTDKLWVLPWKTEGVSTVIHSTERKDIEQSGRRWDAFLDEIPRDWRASFLWGLVRPHAPRLQVLPVDALPRWQIKRHSSTGTYFGDHEYPFLDTLIGGWFHQDFDIAGDTLEEVIASYKKVHGLEDWADVRADIQRLLNRYDDQNLTPEFVRLFRPDVNLEFQGVSTRQWLLRIEELLQ